MKRLMTLTAMLVVFGAAVSPVFAVTDPPRVPPKGIEGPDVEAKAELQGAAGPDIRHVVVPPFRGTEGPETR